MKLILITTFIVLFSGCITKTPSVTEYKITSDNSVVTSDSKRCKNKSLKVSQAFSSTSLMSESMNYSLPKNRVFSYSQAKWRESPNHLITNEVLKKVRATKLFKDVQVSKSRSKSNLILEINVEDFMQYFTDDLSNSHAVVSISFSLIDSSTNLVIATKVFNSKVDTNSNDANGGVEALNSALSSVLFEATNWLEKVCK
jgi:cholesterol transport system auxiliary component